MSEAIELELSTLRLSDSALHLGCSAVAVSGPVRIALALLLEAGRVPVADFRREVLGAVVSRRALRTLLGDVNYAFRAVGARARVVVDQGAVIVL